MGAPEDVALARGALVELSKSGDGRRRLLNELQRELAAARPFVPEARWSAIAEIVGTLRVMEEHDDVVRRPLKQRLIEGAA